jgi:hypothetical protein
VSCTYHYQASSDTLQPQAAKHRNQTWLPKQLWHSYCWPMRQRTAANASRSMREEAMLLLPRGVGASTLPLH